MASDSDSRTIALQNGWRLPIIHTEGAEGLPPRQEKPMECPICQAQVKLNEIVRSAHHILGCHYCYGK